MSGSSRRPRSSIRYMPTSKRSTCTGGRWRRRNYRSPNNMRLICSMLSIISKFYFCLEVYDVLNVGGHKSHIVPND
jgi:hypothetical protein